MKNKILTVFLIIAIMFNCTIVSYADETNNCINSNDLTAIEEIYSFNLQVLDWNIDNPLSIESTKWELIDDTYCLVELDLSNTEINGKADISKCNHIENYSFFNTNINEIILPEHLDFIPQSAFEGCSNLDYVNIPQNTKSINNNAFKNCSSLKSVLLNNYITIQSNAFSGCISLECISNANNIISIGRNAFNNCENLVFYDTDEATSYIENYAQTMSYLFSSNMVSNISGYIAVMTSAKEEKSRNNSYRAGTAYLYDKNNVLIEEQKLDTEGKFFFNNLSIGHKYRIIIDGQFAIARTKYIVTSKKENYLSSKESPVHIITCDFDKDGYITSSDTITIYQMAANQEEENILLYDLNGDSGITGADAIIIYALIGFSNYE